MRPFSTMMLGAGGRILLPATTFGILDLSDAGELGADMEAPLCWIRFLTIPQGGDKTSVGCAPGAIREILAVPCNLPAGSSFLFRKKTKINFNILTLKVVSHSCCSLATITCARQQLRPKLGDDRFALLRSKSRAEKKKKKSLLFQFGGQTSGWLMIPVLTGPYGDRSLMGAAAAAQWVKSLSVIERERERESLDLGPGGRHVGNVMNRFLKKHTAKS